MAKLKERQSKKKRKFFIYMDLQIITAQLFVWYGWNIRERRGRPHRHRRCHEDL